MRKKLSFYRGFILSLGLAGAAPYKIQMQRMRFFGIRTSYTLRSQHTRFGLLCRPDTSDMEVFWQIFVKREYR